MVYMTNMNNNTSSEDISNIIVEKEKELAKAINDQATVEQALLTLSKQILDLQFKRKDLQIALSKANQNVRLLNGELRVLRNQFFSARNSGI
jgi:peptidoglycan hydrolase CwlO-like protein